MDIKNSFELLQAYCEKENFKGWDPFDGLNSPVIQKTFLKKWFLPKLVWIQLFKRSPINLRPFFGVKKELNAKGLGLFLTGYCNLYKIDPKTEYIDKINELATKVIALQTPGYSGACWGYNFDWQARAFFQPKGTPTVVATSFVADALFNAYDITGNKLFLTTAISTAQFVLKDLNRSVANDGTFAFSYSPLDKTQVFNASLLGCKLLCQVYQYTKDKDLLDVAKKGIQFVINHQHEDGSWAYGTLPFHQWIDNFHTGYNLECIQYYIDVSSDNLYEKNVQKGLDYYVHTFFTKSGMAKYYNNQTYPIDIHAPAQLMVTLYKLDKYKEFQELASTVLQWTVNHMQHKKGYFIYQKRKVFSPKIPYMRWGQAWMFYGMSYFLLASHKQDTPDLLEEKIPIANQ